jgi:hypothetical protein
MPRRCAGQSKGVVPVRDPRIPGRSVLGPALAGAWGHELARRNGGRLPAAGPGRCSARLFRSLRRVRPHHLDGQQRPGDGAKHLAGRTFDLAAATLSVAVTSLPTGIISRRSPGCMGRLLHGRPFHRHACSALAIHQPPVAIGQGCAALNSGGQGRCPARIHCASANRSRSDPPQWPPLPAQTAA